LIQRSKIKMTDDLDELLNEQTSEAPAASPASAPVRCSKPSRPFTAADRVRIGNLARGGLPAAEIAKRIGRGLPQVSKVVRELGLAPSTPSTLVPVELKLRRSPFGMLEAAARRRDLAPETLASALIDRVIRRGSIDHVLHAG
jgi:hypothetical protein